MGLYVPNVLGFEIGPESYQGKKSHSLQSIGTMNIPKLLVVSDILENRNRLAKTPVVGACSIN